MVLMCDRSTEQREDAVARRLDDIAILTVHRFNHEFERRVYNRSRLLGVQVLLKLGSSP